jgi:GNAT superfamily N-acetyltransferase
MNIKPYSHYDEAEILCLYRAVGWSNYYQRPEMLENAFAHSLCILGAWENDKLIGLIRAVGDGCSIVFIQDLLVHPDHQRRGVGSALMEEMLRRYAHVYQIQLVTDNTEKTKVFYRTQGFRPLDELGCCGFMKT